MNAPPWSRSCAGCLGRLSDPGGPFDGYSYVADTDLSIQRVALINPYVQPDGPAIPGTGTVNWYAHNAAAGHDVAGFCRALSEHEGEGMIGVPESGHTGALRHAIADAPQLDPRHVVEAAFGPTTDAAVTAYDSGLDAVERALHAAASDFALPVIWRGNLDYYDRQVHDWTTWPAEV